jgi:Asp-tRNA(Asn)/Glu-tRNA(Gln) amidotransferase A subunit family amidase
MTFIAVQCSLGDMPDDTADERDGAMMRLALDLARRAAERGEVPVGLNLGANKTSTDRAADFARVEEVFERALEDLKTAGAELVPIEIPGLTALIARRAHHPMHGADAFAEYASRLENAPFRSKAEAMASPLFER